MKQNIQIEILFFAIFKEWVGENSIQIEIPAHLVVSKIFDYLPMLQTKPIPPLRFAVNESFVDKDYLLKEGDRLCLIPPVAGGS